MPYFLRGKCVWKGTKEKPEKEVKCHPTRKKALAHLAALYVNVEDAKKKEDAHTCVCPECGATAEVPLGEKCNEQKCSKCGAMMKQKTSGVEQTKEGIYVYKTEVQEEWQDRWLAVSTHETWDLQGEMFTKEAMDYDIAKAQQTGEYPELRLFHVRGFKLGKCDSMARIGDYAVDQGYWYDTPFAQAMKEIVLKNEGRWRVSRGFHAVEASGLCPECGVGLTVRPLNFIVGAPCPACRTWITPSKLTQLKHVKARTFDLTITDVPAVPSTAVAAYSVKSD